MDKAIPRPVHSNVFALIERLTQRNARLGIMGLGYVGLPLSAAAHRAGFHVVGFDIDSSKIEKLSRNESPVGTVPDAVVRAMHADGRFHATGNIEDLKGLNGIIICVPTPIDRHRSPDLSYVISTVEMIREILCPGQIVILESTTWPGTTDEVVRPILESTGLKTGKDFLLAYSPEREDPGNPQFETSTIPRVVGADDELSLKAVKLLYSAIVDEVIPVSSTRTAEAVKLTENIYRSVNIALVNELKLIFTKMNINIWEVIEAAKSKPFGFHAFYPGPGLGGHCIPVDPFYLSWKAKEFDVPARFIELAGEVNAEAPREVVNTLIFALGKHLRKSLAGSRVLLVGLAYKKNVDDVRESPAVRIFGDIAKLGADIEYHDPYVSEMPLIPGADLLVGRKSVDWNLEILSTFDVALICTDHDNIDYQQLVDTIPLVVDARNATHNVTNGREKIVLA